MNGNYIVFDSATGLITKTVACPVISIHVQVGPSEGFIYGTLESPRTQYVDPIRKLLKARPVMPAQVVGNELIGVPKGATIVIESVEYIADGSNIHLGFDFAGSYDILVHCFPFLDWSTTYAVKASQ